MTKEEETVRETRNHEFLNVECMCMLFFHARRRVFEATPLREENEVPLLSSASPRPRCTVAAACVPRRLGQDCALGLGFLHSHKMVHCDVKPDNFLADEKAHIKLIDFSIALKAQKRKSGLGKLFARKPKQAAGTRSYMAPEQILSQPVDARADIWSLGAVIFEMLSGVKPFANDGNILTTINTIVHKPLPQIEDYLPIVRPEIKRVFSKTLCKDPNGRYSSTLELLRELDGVQRTLLDQQKAVASTDTKVNTDDYLATQDLSEAIARFQEMTMIE